MHRTSILPVACLLWLTQAALAQTANTPFDATHLEEPTQFSMPLLFRAGDDPNWARPDFDDSKWMVVDPNHPLTEYFPQRPRPEVVWYRLHVKVSPKQTYLALQENSLSSAFETFVNGRRVLANGSVAAEPMRVPASAALAIPLESA